MKICKVDGCQKKYSAKGFCRTHYIRLWRWGSENIVKRHLFTGNSSHHLYSTYDSMKQRCYNRNHSNYKNYGARGIKICDRWLGADGFDHFLEDMGEKPRGKYSIDRINNQGNYEPKNCRWSHIITQLTNKRSNNDHPGVYERNRKNKYYSMIERNGKKEYLGSFKTLDEAIHVRKKAEEKYKSML